MSAARPNGPARPGPARSDGQANIQLELQPDLLTAELPRTGLDDLLRRCIGEGASDLHLSADQRPLVRVDGALRPLGDLPVLSAAAVEALAHAVMNEAQAAAFRRDRTLDLALSLAAGQRFRLNVFRTRGQVALAVRRLEEQVRGLDELGLPHALTRLAELESGLVLFAGPTGSGKSTSLATLIDGINGARACHVLTLEDPVEYVHVSRRALVHQRELHSDFESFPKALRSALREDPDVILVGEMRDRATMRAALLAAETGHLVFSTLHAGDAIGATERLVGAFQSQERDSIRTQLALVLRAVVAQRLLPRRDGAGRVPVVELLWMTPAAANLLRANKAPQLYSVMEGQAAAGMQTFEQALAEAVAGGRVHEEDARRVARDPALLEERLRHARRAPGRVSGRSEAGGASWR